MAISTLISVVLVLALSAVLIVTGLKKVPGIGVIVALIVMAATLFLRGDGLAALGFQPPENWVQTVLLGLALGVGIQVLGVVLIEPLSEKLTNTRHDHSVLDGVRGNWLAVVQWLVMVWVAVAFLEEMLFRGFLMGEIARVLGTGTGALAVNVVFTSVVFGFAHGYQERCGIISTGVVGALLALIFVWSDFNLWLAIFTHGFIDTIGIGMIAINADHFIRERLWKE